MKNLSGKILQFLIGDVAFCLESSVKKKKRPKRSST